MRKVWTGKIFRKANLYSVQVQMDAVLQSARGCTGCRTCGKRIDPEREVKVVNAEGLQNCKKMLQMAKAGKYNGYLLEGMACPGGCVAGAGTLQVVKKAAAALEKMKGEASLQNLPTPNISQDWRVWKSLMWNNIQILQLQRAEFSALCIEKKQAQKVQI